MLAIKRRYVKLEIGKLVSGSMAFKEDLITKEATLYFKCLVKNFDFLKGMANQKC